ncbi:MAG: ATP-dependent helicase, partial [Brevibacterium sp.]|nr:ATP-dependent helicase [Brevibacterium sp.]
RIGRTGRAGNTGIAVTLVDWDDMPRWRLINKALGLDHDEPAETYSTSQHFFADLAIPKGTKGRLRRQQTEGSDEHSAPKKSEQRRGGSSGGSGSSAGGEGRTKPRRNRERRRTRGGKPVGRTSSAHRDSLPSAE